MAYYLHLGDVDATIYIYNNNGPRIYLGMVIVVISKRRALTVPLHPASPTKKQLKGINIFQMDSFFNFPLPTGNWWYGVYAPHSPLYPQQSIQ